MGGKRRRRGALKEVDTPAKRESVVSGLATFG